MKIGIELPWALLRLSVSMICPRNSDCFRDIFALDPQTGNYFLANPIVTRTALLHQHQPPLPVGAVVVLLSLGLLHMPCHPFSDAMILLPEGSEEIKITLIPQQEVTSSCCCKVWRKNTF